MISSPSCRTRPRASFVEAAISTVVSFANGLPRASRPMSVVLRCAAALALPPQPIDRLDVAILAGRFRVEVDELDQQIPHCAQVVSGQPNHLRAADRAVERNL